MTRHWTNEADDRLSQILEAGHGQGLSWQDIAVAAFPDGSHSPNDCMERGRAVMATAQTSGKTSVNLAHIKGPWSPEEDRQLKSLVAQLNTSKWGDIAKHIGSRSGKQCRERWHNHLNPTINKTAFSAEEDRLIMQMHAQIGPKWAEIARALPGRPDNAIKNHFNTTLARGRARRESTSSATSTSRSSGSPAPGTPGGRRRSMLQSPILESPSSPRYSPYTRSRDTVPSPHLPVYGSSLPEPSTSHLTRSQSSASLGNRRSLRTSLQMTPARSLDYGNMHIAMPPQIMGEGFLPSGPTTAPVFPTYARPFGVGVMETWSTPPMTPELSQSGHSAETFFGSYESIGPGSLTSPAGTLQAALDDLALSPGNTPGAFHVPSAAPILPPSPPSPNASRDWGKSLAASTTTAMHLRASSTSSLAFFDQGLPGGRNSRSGSIGGTLAAPFEMAPPQTDLGGAEALATYYSGTTPPISSSSSCSTSSSSLSAAAPYFNDMHHHPASTLTTENFGAISPSMAFSQQAHVYTAHVLRSQAKMA